MKAIVHERYGPPDLLELRDVEPPEIGDDQVLVRVHASSVNPVDWYGVTGLWLARLPNALRKPKDPRVGLDVAGRIEAVGTAVTTMHHGDDVFGSAIGAWAEFAVADAAKLAPKPASVSFDEAGAVSIAGRTALQAIRDHGCVKPGQKVLVNGASGGVGTFAVQIAKAFGADVTAVCSTRNVDLVRSLGADRVVDYTQEDFTRHTERHDVLLDVTGSRRLSELRRVLTPKANVVLIGAPMKGHVVGPLPHMIGTRLAGIGRSQTVKFMLAKPSADDLAFLGGLFDAGTVRPVIDRRYGLSEAANALGYLGEGHARGKVVIVCDPIDA
jgi:NADPH:quinone reductase-like Zn-dependent oxidoreductase